MTLNTALQREKGISFPEYYAQNAAGGKMSLRRRQYSAAMDGNSAMLIWLGKQWLGQKEPEKEADKSTAELAELIKELINNKPS